MKAEMESFIREIEAISDAAELRRLLVVLKKENIELKNRESETLRMQDSLSQVFQEVQAENEGLRKENKELKERLLKAENKDTLKANRLFGRSTEKTEALLGTAGNGTETADPLDEDANADAPEKNPDDEDPGRKGKKRKPHGKRRKGKRAEDLSKLPHRIVYEYDEDELDRLYGKGNWRIVGWHKSTKKEVIPSVVYARTTCTPVVSYGLGHQMACVPLAYNLLPGSDVSESLGAWFMNNKFTLGLPYYRQEKELERRGIAISRQNMTDWTIRFSRERFAQVYGHLAKCLKESGCTQCDETTLLVIRDGRKAGRKSYMWIHITSEYVTVHPVAVFTYEPDRSTRHLREFYEDYIGEIICDAYSAYQTFETENGDKVIICGCWMHSRRRWAEALRTRCVKGLSEEEIAELPEARALRMIGDIYKEEAKLKGLPAAERLAGRKANVKEKVDRYFTFLDEFDLESEGISERMKDAISYSLNQKKHLCRFLTRGNVPLDNGACERRARAFGIGRNGWMFCTSPKGAEACAIMYSLVETAKSNGADVYFYLKYLLEKTPSSPELKLSEKYLETLMPWSPEYKEYETRQKKEWLETSLPPSQEEPTGRKLMKYTA